jgi:hypothetical protein
MSERTTGAISGYLHIYVRRAAVITLRVEARHMLGPWNLRMVQEVDRIGSAGKASTMAYRNRISARVVEEIVLKVMSILQKLVLEIGRLLDVAGK